MLFSELQQLVSSPGFTSRIFTAMGVRSSQMCDEFQEQVPGRYRELCTEGAELLALEENQQVYVYSAPGRVVYAGAHGSSRGGTMLSAPVNPDSLALLRPRNDGQIVVYSRGYEQPAHVDGADTRLREDERGSSQALVRGAAAIAGAWLEQQGRKLSGFDAYVHSHISPGCGLDASSSFCALMLGCMLDQPHPGKTDSIPDINPSHAASMIRSIEEQYFGEEGDLESAGVIFSGGLRICSRDENSLFRKVEQSQDLYDLAHYLLDSQSGDRSDTGIQLHLRQELDRVLMQGDKTGEPASGADKESIEHRIFLNYFTAENLRCSQMVQFLRSGNLLRFKCLLQEQFQEQRNFSAMLCRNTSQGLDHTDLLYSSLSLQSARGGHELMYGPMGKGLDGKILCIVPMTMHQDFERSCRELIPAPGLLRLTPREKGVLRLI